MAQLPMDEAVQRFKGNEERFDSFVNDGDTVDVTTRNNQKYPTLQKAIKQIVQSKGVLPASVYERLAELPTSPTPTVGDLALVINDAVDKNGVYKYKDAKWTLMSWSELNASSLYFVESKIYEVSGKNKVYANVSSNCHLSETGGKPFLKDILPADTARGVRTAILAVKPNTKYIIRLPEVTDMFRVAVFDSKMGYVGVYADEHITYGRMVYDKKEGEVKIGSYEVQTGSDDHVLAVTYSLRKVPSRGIEIYEANRGSRKDGKNIALQDYKLKGVALSEIANSTKYKPVSIETAVTYWIPVKANTTYTISKQPSNRFVVTQMEEFTESISGGTAYRVRNRLLYKDDSKNSVTVTTSASAYFMGLYVSNASENPFIQVEEGGNQTLWVTAGYADDVEKPLSSNTSLTVSATDGDMSDTLLQAVKSASGSKLTLKSGVYRISKTIDIPSNTTVEGEGDVVIQALDGGSFTKVNWRHLQVEVFVRTNESSSNVKLKNITAKGAGVTNNNFMQWGICVQGSSHKLQDVNVYDINWIDSEAEEVRAGGNGWGLVVYKAKDIRNMYCESPLPLSNRVAVD